MQMHDILQNLADTLPAQRLRRIPLLAADKYILASGFQKSIRRGDAQKTASFALSLAYADRRMLWRRLLVTGFEDIGIANPALIAEIVAVSQNPAFRRKVGDVEVALYLAKKMAASVKSRYLTEAIFLTDLGQSLSKARQSLPKASNRKLSSIILDPEQPAPARFLALWGLAGTKLYAAKGFSRDGDMDAAVKTLRKLPLPAHQIEASIAALKSMQWPLPLFLPLALATVQGEELAIHKEQPVSSPEFEDVPMYAIDPLYTRLGQGCLRQLQKQAAGLKGYSPAQMGECLFFIEGENLDCRLTSPHLEAFRQDSIDALMQDLGLAKEDHQTLKRCLIKYFDRFNDIRLAQFERSVHGTRKGLLL